MIEFSYRLRRAVALMLSFILLFSVNTTTLHAITTDSSEFYVTETDTSDNPLYSSGSSDSSGALDSTDSSDSSDSSDSLDSSHHTESTESESSSNEPTSTETDSTETESTEIESNETGSTETESSETESTETVEIPALTQINPASAVMVSTWAELVAAVSDTANAGETIALANDIIATNTATVSVNGITIYGDGHTITRAASMTAGSMFNITITANADITFENITIDGANIPITGNGAGIIMNTAGTNRLTILNSTFMNNVVSGHGGAIHTGLGSAHGGVIVFNSTFVGNRATGNTSDGGAIAAGFGEITNSTFFGNQADRGAALRLERAGGRIVNTTMTGNIGGGARGSIFFGNATLLINTIVVNNVDGPQNAVRDWQDGGSNLVSTIEARTNPQASTTVNILGAVDWLDTELRDNGGLTQTVALLDVPGSLAIDRGTLAGSPTTDQRGTIRSSTPDIGAYELIPPPIFGTQINNISIDGLVLPAVGETPNTAITVGANATLTSIEFSPADAVFAPGRVYSAVITITANAGFTFTNRSTVTHNLSDALLHSISIPQSGQEANTLVYTLFFPRTASDSADGHNLSILRTRVTAPNAAQYYEFRRSRATTATEYQAIGVGFGGDMYSYNGNFYTFKTNGSLSERREFTFSATFEYDGVFDPARVSWWHGTGGTVNTATNRPMTAQTGGTGAVWTRANYMGTGNTPLFRLIGDQEFYHPEPGMVTVTATFEVDGGLNITRGSFTDIRFNTWNNFRNATTRVYYDNQEVASRPFRIPMRDFMYSWLEFDEWIESIKPTVNQWSDSNRNITLGDGSFSNNNRFVKLESLGLSSGFITTGGSAFERYEPKDIWSGVVADSRASVEYYLNVVVPTMNSGTPAQIAALMNNPNARQVIYYSNNHSDEHHGPDSIMYLFREIAKGQNIYGAITEDIAKQTMPAGTANRNVLAAGATITEFEICIDELLERYIFVFTFMENPDGRDFGGRTANYRFDPNRDAAFQVLPESVASKRNIARWDPLSFIEFHSERPILQIDPTAAPHDPNYEADLFFTGARADRRAGLMNRQAHAMGGAALATGVRPAYVIPEEDLDTQFERFDGLGPAYSPQFAMHFGTLAVTIESESVTARDAWANFIISYGALYDQLNNWEDYWNFKFEYKRRGVVNENTDAIVNPHLFSSNPLQMPLLTRQIPLGGTKFFPDFYVIPMDSTQLDISQAMEAVRYLTRAGVAVRELTSPLQIGETTYPAGTFVVDMRQGNRFIANVALFKGTDASIMAGRPYSTNNVTNLPALRGFTSDRVEANVNLNASNSRPANYNIVSGLRVIQDDRDLPRSASRISGSGDYVILRNAGLDTLRLVFAALGADGRTAFPVSMITEEPPIGFRIGDFVMRHADYALVNTGGNEFLVEGSRVAASPAGVTELVRPRITVYSANAFEWPLTFENFGMRLHGMGALNITDNNRPDVRRNTPIAGQNVIINFDQAIAAGTNTAITTALGNNTAGFIQVGTGGLATAGGYLGTGFASTTISAGTEEALLTGTYARDSIVTARTENARYVYVRSGSSAITSMPEGAVPLIMTNDYGRTTSLEFNPESSFLAGRAASVAARNGMKGRTLGAAGTFGGDPDGATVIIFTVDIFDKAHNEFSHRMLGNAILLAAAGIDPNFEEPEPSVVTFDLQGGELPIGEPNYMEVTEYGTLLDLPEPTRVGFHFAGWFTEVDGEGDEITLSTVFERDTEVFAHWIEIFTITFDTGYADITASPLETDINGQIILPVLTGRAGYVHTGWSLTADGAVLPADHVFTASVALYAIWEEITGFVVTFFAEAGAVAHAVMQTNQDDRLNSLPVDPTRENYIFMGWFGIVAGDNVEITLTTVFEGDTAVYAEWEPVTTAPPTTSVPTAPEGTTSMPTSPEGTTPAPTAPEGTTSAPTAPEGTTSAPTAPEGTTPSATTAPAQRPPTGGGGGGGGGTLRPTIPVTTTPAPATPVATEPIAAEYVETAVAREQINLRIATGEFLVVEADTIIVILPFEALEEIREVDGNIVVVNARLSTLEDNVLAVGSVNIRSDEHVFEVFDNPMQVSVLLGELDADMNPHRIVAVLDDGTFTTGVFDPETGWFTFEKAMTGDFVIEYVEDLQWINMQVGSYLITDNAQATQVVMDVVPVIVDDRTLVPLRFIAYALGANVHWNGGTSEVTLDLDDMVLTFAIGALVLGMDVPAQIINDRTVVPVRFISEFFGATVNWNEETQVIEIVRRP